MHIELIKHDKTYDIYGIFSFGAIEYTTDSNVIREKCSVPFNG